MLVATPPVQKIDPPAPLVKRFLDYIFLECGLAGNTVTAYQSDLRGFWDFVVEHDLEPSDLNIQDIQAYLITLQRRQFALSSITRHLATVKVFLRFLFAERVLKHDLAALIESTRRWSKIPRVPKIDAVETMLHAPDPVDDLYLRDRALLEFFYATGLRVSEVVDLNLDQVNLKLGYLRCVGKGRKERIVPIGRMAIRTLQAYQEELRPRLLGDRHCDRLFLSRTGRPLDRTNLWRIVRKYAATSGMKESVSPHTLRHAFATHLLAGGADLRVVQELLGHADVTTTQIYTHVDETQLKRVHQKYHPRP